MQPNQLSLYATARIQISARIKLRGGKRENIDSHQPQLPRHFAQKVTSVEDILRTGEWLGILLIRAQRHRPGPVFAPFVLFSTCACMLF